MRLLMAGRVMAPVGLSGANLPAKSLDVGHYPLGYRQWTLARFRFVGPRNPNYEKRGGFRHHFANAGALASWGKFRDGAVIVAERVHAALDDDGIWQAGDLAHVAVMRKDSKHFTDTGGWYFNLFNGYDTSIGLTPAQAKASRFDSCHTAQVARDFVFSDPRS